MTDHTLKPDEIDRIWKQVAEQRPEFVPRKKGAEVASILVEPNENFEPAAFTPPKPAGEPTFEEFTANSKAAIDGLTLASKRFEDDFGKPNVRLHSALKRYEAAQEELRAAEAELNAIRAEGDSVDRFVSAVNRGARAFEALGNYARNLIGNDLILKQYGRLLPSVCNRWT
jgi:hypothetical protein